MKKELIAQVVRRKPRPDVCAETLFGISPQMALEFERDVLVAWIERLYLGKSRVELH